MVTRYDAACDCGFSNSYDSAARADYALRQHSCDKTREKIAAASRRDAREAALDRTPKPCNHKVADHQHGTRAAYVLDRCRCLPCSRANAEAEGWRERQKAYGRYDKYVDAGPAREHLRHLMATGMGLKQIYRQPGVSAGQVWKLLYGKKQADGVRTPSVRILRTTAERLLAIEPSLAGGALIDNADTTRRLQALVAVGWSATRIGARLGIDATNMPPLIHGRRPVTASTATKVHEVYLQLAELEPPAATPAEQASVTRAKNWARREGWALPLRVGGRLVRGVAYDIDLDEVEPVLAPSDVDEAVVHRVVLEGRRPRRLSHAETVEVCHRLVAMGHSRAQIERDWGINVHRFIGPESGAA